MRIAWTHRLAAGAIAALTGLALGATGAAAQTPASLLVIRSIDGAGNNLQHPTWGQAGQAYRRVAPANYADGKSQHGGRAKPAATSATGSSTTQPERVLRARRHPVGLGVGPVPRPHLRPARRAAGATGANIPFNASDPLEELHQQPRRASRSPAPAAAPGHQHRQPAPADQHAAARTSTRSAVYGGTDAAAGLAARRLAGRQPGQQRGHADAAGNGYLPRADARGNAATAPADGPSTAALVGAPAGRRGRRRRAGQREHRA